MINRKALRVLCAAILSSVVTLHSAWALTLEEAKSKGLVGETLTGYLAAVSAPTGEVQGIIASVNAQRRQKYAEIAQRNRTSVAAVEALAGQKAVDATAPGNFVQKPNGSWARK